MSQHTSWGVDLPALPEPDSDIPDGDTRDDDSYDGADAGVAGPARGGAGSWPDEEREATSSCALFEGDEGTLEVEVRRALVVLLKQRFITARTHPHEWRALVGAQRLVRSQLNNLFLDLHLDTGREVAWKRQVAPEGGGRPFPTLLYDTPWGREDTILLVYLRSKFRHDLAGGADRVYVDRQDMLDHVAELRPATATDKYSDTRRAERAVEALYKAGLLIGPSTGDRFEVCAAIEALVPLESLQQLLVWLRRQNRSDAPAGADHESADDENVDDESARGESAEDEGVRGGAGQES